MSTWSPSFWPANYWQPSYWQPYSFTGSIAQALADVTPTITGVVWRKGPIAATDSGVTAAFVGTITNNSGNYWAENYWAPQFWSPQYWKTVEPSVGTGSISAAAAFTSGALIGTSTGASTITGTIGAAIDGVAGLIGGILVQSDYVDITLAVQLAWSSQEFAGFNGSIARTLDATTFAAVGQFTAAGARIGFLNPILADVSGALSGTNTVPATRTGNWASTLDAYLFASNGFISQPAGRVGQIDVLADDVSASINGSAFIPALSGTITGNLDSILSTAGGLVFDGYTVIGRVNAFCDGIDCRMVGSFVAAPPVPARRVFDVEFDDYRFDVEFDSPLYDVEEA